SESLFYRRIEQFLRLLSWLSIVVAVPMSFLSGTIITVLFGKSYEASAAILAIHIWASLFVFMGVGTSPWFIAEGLTQFALRRTIIGAVTNVFLNILLIPAYGGIGAAISTLISQSVAAFFSNAIDSKTRKIFNLQVKVLLPFRI
ncbi:MAG: polysaccharide biosynthesis C-terminal domain-containing protein, partial [Dolichospermum sp.]